jgi:hypothetical protein
MNKHLQIFGITVLLFILLQPNLYMKIPTTYHFYFILLHCLLFATVYIFIRTYFFDLTVETFTDEEKTLFDNKRLALETDLNKKYSKDEQSKIPQSEIESKKKSIMKDLSEEQKQKFEKYNQKIKNRGNELVFKKEIKEEATVNDSIQEKMEYLLNKASVEQILLLGSLSQSHKDALEKLLEAMDIKEVEKYLKLDIDQLKESIDKVVKLA